MLNMERDIIKKQLSIPNLTSSSTSGLHRNSQTISKVKPKIRIIHIFSPEIIKTDVENFRELVQRLTGKPAENCKTSKRRKIIPRKEKPAKNIVHSHEFKERVKGEEEIWRWANSGGGFLGNFPEIDGGFMAELNGFITFLPMELDGSSDMDAYGEP